MYTPSHRLQLFNRVNYSLLKQTSSGFLSILWAKFPLAFFQVHPSASTNPHKYILVKMPAWFFSVIYIWVFVSFRSAEEEALQ